MHAHLQLACTCISQNRSLDPDHVTLPRTHTHARTLVRTGSTHRIARYEVLKAAEPGLQHELAHTCALEGAPINTQPDPRAVG